MEGTAAPISPENTSGLRITFNDLEYSVIVCDKKNRQPRQILNKVNGYFKPGRFTAIMGASGAGKTSLLNVLAGEAKDGNLSGRIYVNGEEIHGEGMKKISGFVFQEDVILASSTVLEAVTMSATLRLPSTISAEERSVKVEKILHMLGLQNCRNTLIGNSKIKGISGGERKRCAIAMELITEPNVLYLDEPTSGLDTFTAYAVIKILSNIAHVTNRTVIATIHQPSSEIFHMFDDLLLMANGGVVYQGLAKGATSYFAKHGYKCPIDVNPADYLFMDVLNNEPGGETAYMNSLGERVVEENRERIKRLLELWPTTPNGKSIESECKTLPTGQIEKKDHRTMTTIDRQAAFLVVRDFISSLRNPLVVRSRTIQAVAVGIFIGGLYFSNPNNTVEAQFQNKLGVLFFLAMTNVFSSTTENLSVFGEEKHVFVREHGLGYYTLPAFFWSKILVEIPFQTFFPTIRVLIINWMVGFNSNGKNVMILCALNVLTSFVGFSLGTCIACAFDSLEVGLLVTPLILMPLILFSGFFINSDSIPIWLKWIKWVSPIKYSFEGMLKNEYEGAAEIKTIMTQLGIDDGLGVSECSAILLGMTAAFILLAYYCLWRLISKRGKAKKKSA